MNIMIKKRVKAAIKFIAKKIIVFINSHWRLKLFLITLLKKIGIFVLAKKFYLKIIQGSGIDLRAQLEPAKFSELNASAQTIYYELKNSINNRSLS